MRARLNSVLVNFPFFSIPASMFFRKLEASAGTLNNTCGLMAFRLLGTFLNTSMGDLPMMTEAMDAPDFMKA